MAGEIIVVKAARDADAGVWFVEESDVPGLRLEAESLEALMEKIPGAILDLLEVAGPQGAAAGGLDLPVELIAHASTRVRRAAA